MSLRKPGKMEALISKKYISSKKWPSANKKYKICMNHSSGEGRWSASKNFFVCAVKCTFVKQIILQDYIFFVVHVILAHVKKYCAHLIILWISVTFSLFFLGCFRKKIVVTFLRLKIFPVMILQLSFCIIVWVVCTIFKKRMFWRGLYFLVKKLKLKEKNVCQNKHPRSKYYLARLITKKKCKSGPFTILQIFCARNF